MRNSESEEMYLETLFKLSKKTSSIYSVDIVNTLNYAKSSVSRAVNLLEKKGFIEILKNGELVFTSIGLEKAKSIYNKHLTLTEFFKKIGVEEKSAEENACKIEHVISDDAFESLKAYLHKIA